MNENIAKQIWGGKFPFRHVDAEEPVEQPRVRGLMRVCSPCGKTGKVRAGWEVRGLGDYRARKLCCRQKS